MLAMQTGGAAPSSSDLRVVVSAVVYQPDGNRASEGVAMPGDEPGVVHVFGRRSLCDATSTGAAEPDAAAFGWRVATHVIRAADSALVVGVDWARLWESGAKTADGPAGSVQLTLRPGDRIPLDLLSNRAPSESCRAVAMALELSATRAAARVEPEASLLPLGAVAGGARPMDADVWLVHAKPSGVAQAEHQRVRLSGDGGTFAFSPVVVPAARGDAVVALSGTFRRYRAATGGEFLFVSMTRRVSGAGSAETVGTTGTVMPLPNPNEVLALNIPATQRTLAGGTVVRVGRGGGGAVVQARTGSGGPRPGTAPTSPQPPSPPAQGTFGVGGGGGRATPPGESGILSRLEGHVFSVRLRLTPER
jgi:hypothetical protein